jgi:hypothetical protein
MSLKIRRGTNSERLTIIPAEGELLYTTDTKKIFVGDGTTTGGSLVTGGLSGNLADNLYLDNHNIIGQNLTVNGRTGTISAASVTAHLRGSVYADDSTVLVDSIQGKVVGPIDVDVTHVRIAGGTSGQVLTTNGNGVISWSNKTNALISLASLTDVSLFNLRPNDTLKWNGIEWINSTMLSGHFNGDITGSVFSDHSTKLIDGITGNISNGYITFNGNSINTIGTGDIVIGTYAGTQTTLRLQANQTNLIFDGISTDDVFNGPSTPALSSEISRKNINGSKRTVVSGDVLFSQNFFGYDGTQQIISSQIIPIVDHNASVTTDEVPGKLLFITCPTSSTYKLLTFDSAGKLAINKLDADQELDVEGNGKFSGFVQFGSLTATQRAALTPANGMVIYNSTANRFQGYQASAWINLDDGTSAT